MASTPGSPAASKASTRTRACAISASEGVNAALITGTLSGVNSELGDKAVAGGVPRLAFERAGKGYIRLDQLGGRHEAGRLLPGHEQRYPPHLLAARR
jgi:hypothetical protein